MIISFGLVEYVETSTISLFQTSMLIVDDAITDTEMVPDIFMDKAVPSELPYNKKSRFVHKRTGFGHC